MMKLSSKVLYFILAHLIFVDRSAVIGAKLKCEFSTCSWNSTPSLMYCCKVKDNGIFNNTRAIIDGIEGTHSDGKSNDDVLALSFYGITSLNVLPQQLGNYFRNLITFHIGSLNLRVINQQDLKPFPKLEYFFCYTNQITAIEKDLFKFNPELKTIFIGNNKISHIDPNVFDELHKLDFLYLTSNRCNKSFDSVQSRSEVLQYVSRIRNGECSLPDQLNKIIALPQVSNEDKLQVKYATAITENEILVKNLTELQVQYEDVQGKFIKSEQVNKELTQNLSEMRGKLQESEKLIEKLNDRKKETVCEGSNINLLTQLNELRIKYENLLENKLIESEKVKEQMINFGRKNAESKSEADNDQEKKENNDGNCVSLCFGNNQPPLLLVH